MARGTDGICQVDDGVTVTVCKHLWDINYILSKHAPPAATITSAQCDAWHQRRKRVWALVPCRVLGSVCRSKGTNSQHLVNVNEGS